MVNDEIIDRLKRIYSAIEAVKETDFEKFEPTIVQDGQTIVISQDFTGNLSEEQLSNLAQSLIDNIASLYNHLRRWARHKKLKVSQIDGVFNSSRELKIIHDLWNNDKHGYPPRDGGHSGLSPRIISFTRGMQLTTPAEKSGTAVLTLNGQGIPRISGSGSLAVVVSGEISDGDGNIIGNLHLIAVKALEAWEEFLSVLMQL